MAGEKSCIKLAGCNTIDDTDRIRGAVFFLPRDQFDPVGENEHYLVDIIGFHVWDENQQSLGTVTDILTMTAQNIIVIKTFFM